MAECRECGAPIVWAKTSNAKTIPVDDGYDTRGNVTLHQTAGGAPFAKVWTEAAKADLAAPDPNLAAMRFAHFATCPARNGGRNPYAVETEQGSLLDPAIQDLVDNPPAGPDEPEGSSLDDRFAAFHAAHPEVYDELRKLAVTAKHRGRDRLGMKMLFEVLRWQRILAGLPAEGEEFKLNNNYTSRYARLLMEQTPELAGMFETRELTT